MSSLKWHVARFSLFVLFLWPLVGHSSDDGKYVGAYFSHANEAGRTGSYMNLSLGYDRTATLSEDPGTGSETTLFGHWAASANGITLTFDPQEGKPTEPPMTFTSGKEGLQAVNWNHALWGKETPPPMQKGGQKVKQRYWLTTTP
jgi:hypothetical protein